VTLKLNTVEGQHLYIYTDFVTWQCNASLRRHYWRGRAYRGSRNTGRNNFSPFVIHYKFHLYSVL